MIFLLDNGGMEGTLPVILNQKYLSYIDKLQKLNSEDLAFYPKSALEKAIDKGKIIVALENEWPCGYLWYGALREDYPTVIYQACIDYDVRRRQFGFSMVKELIEICRAANVKYIRLRCASSSQSNDFWKAIGFVCTEITQGGIKRKRDINHWWTSLTPGVEILNQIEPSTKSTDLSSYNKDKRSGIIMPSRFSRSHYLKSSNPNISQTDKEIL